MADSFAADLMVGRSGAGTVVETAVVGLPVIFVPLPHGNGEQSRNATSLVAGGGGFLVADADFDGARMSREVLDRITDADALAAMAAVGPTLFTAGAAERVARIVLDQAGAPMSGDDHVA